jgi:hypothetical protein
MQSQTVSVEAPCGSGVDVDDSTSNVVRDGLPPVVTVGVDPVDGKWTAIPLTEDGWNAARLWSEASVSFRSYGFGSGGYIELGMMTCDEIEKMFRCGENGKPYFWTHLSRDFAWPGEKAVELVMSLKDVLKEGTVCTVDLKEFARWMWRWSLVKRRGNPKMWEETISAFEQVKFWGLQTDFPFSVLDDDFDSDAFVWLMWRCCILESKTSGRLRIECTSVIDSAYLTEYVCVLNAGFKYIFLREPEIKHKVKYREIFNFGRHGIGVCVAQKWNGAMPPGVPASHLTENKFLVGVHANMSDVATKYGCSFPKEFPHCFYYDKELTKVGWLMVNKVEAEMIRGMCNMIFSINRSRGTRMVWVGVMKVVETNYKIQTSRTEVRDIDVFRRGIRDFGLKQWMVDCFLMFSWQEANRELSILRQLIGVASTYARLTRIGRMLLQVGGSGKCSGTLGGKMRHVGSPPFQWKKSWYRFMSVDELRHEVSETLIENGVTIGRDLRACAEHWAGR